MCWMLWCQRSRVASRLSSAVEAPARSVALERVLCYSRTQLSSQQVQCALS